jgi:hypothetical protein
MNSAWRWTKEGETWKETPKCGGGNFTIKMEKLALKQHNQNKK